MPLLALLIGLFVPRIALIVFWLFGTFSQVPTGSCCLAPVVGLIFLPYTFLAYSASYVLFDGMLGCAGALLILIGFCMDAGVSVGVTTKG